MCGSKGSAPTPSAASTTTAGTSAGTSTGVFAQGPSAFAAPLYQEYLTRAQGLSNTPFNPATLSSVAPLTAEQTGGVQAMYTQGLDAGNFDPAKVQSMESPFIQDVVNASQDWFNNQNAIQSRDLLGQGIRSGNAFGGDREGIAQAEMAGQQQLAQAPVIAGLYQSGYTQALDEYNKLKQFGLLGAEEALKAGTVLQAQQQRERDIATQNAQMQEAYPFQLANWYGSALGGIAPLTGTVGSAQTATTANTTGITNPPTPNPLTTALGIGSSLVGIGGGLGLFASGGFVDGEEDDGSFGRDDSDGGGSRDDGGSSYSFYGGADDGGSYSGYSDYSDSGDRGGGRDSRSSRDSEDEDFDRELAQISGKNTKIRPPPELAKLKIRQYKQPYSALKSSPAMGGSGMGAATPMASSPQQQQSTSSGGGGGNSWLDTLGSVAKIGAGVASIGAFLSDPKTKTDVQRVGKTDDGESLYGFRYKGDPKTYPKVVGKMARPTREQAKYLALGGSSDDEEDNTDDLDFGDTRDTGDTLDTGDSTTTLAVGDATEPSQMQADMLPTTMVGGATAEPPPDQPPPSWLVPGQIGGVATQPLGGPERPAPDRPQPTTDAQGRPQPMTGIRLPSVPRRAEGFAERWARNPFTQAGIAMLNTRSPYLGEGLAAGMAGASRAAIANADRDQQLLDTKGKMITSGDTIQYQVGDMLYDTKIPTKGRAGKEMTEYQREVLKQRQAEQEAKAAKEKWKPTGFVKDGRIVLYNETTGEQRLGDWVSGHGPPQELPQQKTEQPTTQAPTPPKPGETAAAWKPNVDPDVNDPAVRELIPPDRIPETKGAETARVKNNIKMMDEARKQNDAASAQIARMTEMEAALGKLPTTGLLAPGIFAPYARSLAQGFNDLARRAGFTNWEISPEQVAAMEEADKIKTIGGFLQSRLTGGGQHNAATIIQSSMRAYPGAEQSPQGAALILAANSEVAQRDRDLYSFLNKHGNTTFKGDYNAATNAFDRLNPMERYVERARARVEAKYGTPGIPKEPATQQPATTGAPSRPDVTQGGHTYRWNADKGKYEPLRQ